MSLRVAAPHICAKLMSIERRDFFAENMVALMSCSLALDTTGVTMKEL